MRTPHSKNVFPMDVNLLFIDMNMDSSCICVTYCCSDHRYDSKIFDGIKKIAVDHDSFGTFSRVDGDNSVFEDISIFSFLIEDNDANIKEALFLAAMNGCKIGMSDDPEMENYFEQIKEHASIVSSF